MTKTIGTIALLAATALAVPATAQQLRLMTGPQGGSWYPLGGAIQGMAEPLGVRSRCCRAAASPTCRACRTATPTSASPTRSRPSTRSRGASRSRARPTTSATSRRSTRSISRSSRSDGSGIDSPEDFAGKRLATQPVGNTAEQVTRAVLQAAGLSYDDLEAVDYVSYSDGVALMQDNNSDIFTLGTTIPASAIMDLANSTDIKLVELDEDFIGKMREEINPGYTAITIPAGTYPGQDEDVTAVGYATHVDRALRPRPEVVEGILTQMWENRQDLAAIAAAMKDITLEEHGAGRGRADARRRQGVLRERNGVQM